MTPIKTSALGLFNQTLQYLVPIFQRGYVWTIEKQIRLLWDDIVDRASDIEGYDELFEVAQRAGNTSMLKAPRKHFLGTVIISDHRPMAPGVPATAEVIDGQQRMTTMQVLALAFRDAIAGVQDEFDRHSIDIYTLNAAHYRELHFAFKVWPTNAGRNEMKVLVEARSFENVCNAFPIAIVGSGKSKTQTKRPLLVQAYLYFFGAISYFLRGVDFDELLLPEPGSLEELADEAMAEAGHEVDYTLAALWANRIQEENHPQLDILERPILRARINLLLRTLNEFIHLIELRLDQDDDAQIIFESLNGRGEKLTAADLVRNFVFLAATKSNLSAPTLYESHWRDFDEEPAEKGSRSESKLFWKVEERQGRLTNTRLDTLLYHYVSMRTTNEVKLDHVFEEFKQWWQAGSKDVNRELARLKESAELFRAMVLPDRTTRFGRFAHNLRVLDSSTATPVVLWLAEKLGTQSAEFFDCLSVIESYLVRRAICALTPKAYNRTFPALLKKLRSAESPSSADIAAYFKSLGGDSQIWPDDARFAKEWTESSTYKVMRSGRGKMVLEALELVLRNPVHHEYADLPTVSLHVEHVLPQIWKEHWPSPGDENAELARDVLLHNIGNLTLLTSKLNPALSNSSFDVKRPEITKSLLALNAHFQDPVFAGPDAKWDEDCIRARSAQLFALAIKIWPH